MKKVLVLALLVLLGLGMVWWKYPTGQQTEVNTESRTPPADKTAPPGVPEATRPAQGAVAEALQDSAASVAEFPNLQQACSELLESRRAEGNSNWTPWFIEHYPNELAVLARYESGAQTNWAEFVSMDAEVLRQQAKSGNVVSAGALGARLSMAIGSVDAGHLAKLQEAEKWLLLAIRNREPGLWGFYSSTRAELATWPTWNRIMELRRPGQTIPTAEIESQISALRETGRQVRDMEWRAIDLFSRPYQLPLDRIMFGFSGPLAARWDVPVEDGQLRARVAVLEETFKGADLYAPNDLQRIEIEAAEQARKTVDGVRSRIAAACDSTTQSGSWTDNQPAG